MNLVRIERSIAFYNISDEHIVGECNIDTIAFNELAKIVIPPADDPELYEGHVLNKIQLESINSCCQIK